VKFSVGETSGFCLLGCQ